MSIAELVKSVETIVDDTGHKKVVLDWHVWQEIVAILEGYFQPQTALGQRLWAARAEILAAGVPTLNAAQLEQEIADRRGGQG